MVQYDLGARVPTQAIELELDQLPPKAQGEHDFLDGRIFQQS